MTVDNSFIVCTSDSQLGSWSRTDCVHNLTNLGQVTDPKDLRKVWGNDPEPIASMLRELRVQIRSDDKSLQRVFNQAVRNFDSLAPLYAHTSPPQFSFPPTKTQLN